MATHEQIEYVFNHFISLGPENIFKSVNDTNAGMGAVIRILNTSTQPVTAGVISQKMGVSTARTAVLLKKMLAKNLIVKEIDKDDARKTLVKLSELGKQKAKCVKKNLFEHLEIVIDKVGMEKVEEFISLSLEIRTAMLANLPAPPKLD